LILSNILNILEISMRIDSCRKCGKELRQHDRLELCQNCGKEFTQFVCEGCKIITEPQYHTHGNITTSGIVI